MVEVVAAAVDEYASRTSEQAQPVNVLAETDNPLKAVQARKVADWRSSFGMVRD